MKRLFCDICGNEITCEKITTDDIITTDYTILRNDTFGRHPLDLCKYCSVNLTRLIRKQGVKENE